MIRKIEIDFALPVELTDDQMRRLDRLVGDICDKNCPEGWVFWPSGMGSKPSFSFVDAAFLDKPGSFDPSIASGDEPQWDDSVFQIDCAARELSPEEIEQRKEREQIKEARAAVRKSLAGRFASWLHRHGFKDAAWWICDAQWWFHRKIKRRFQHSVRAKGGAV